jgi:hypothetical protein
MKNFLEKLDWKVYLVLAGAGVIAVLAVMPYSVALLQDRVAELPVSLRTLVIAQSIQAIILMGIVVFFAMLLEQRTSIGLPVIRPLVHGREVPPSTARRMAYAAVWGVAAAVVLILVDLLFIRMGVTLGAEAQRPAWWQGLLASLYGGIGEELQMRFFFVNLLVWLGMFAWKDPEGRPPAPLVIVAIVLVAVVFGLGHLPMTAQVAQLTSAIVLRAIVLNGLAGIVFGVLFWKWGLLTAIIAHFSADIVLHVIAPLF